MQLSTTEGNSYYVGTKMDAFVFDTLNAWYQEDAGVNSVCSSAFLLQSWPSLQHNQSCDVWLLRVHRPSRRMSTQAAVAAPVRPPLQQADPHRPRHSQAWEVSMPCMQGFMHV